MSSIDLRLIRVPGGANCGKPAALHHKAAQLRVNNSSNQAEEKQCGITIRDYGAIHNGSKLTPE
ncbi:hypothetical protein AB0B50_02990 [Streptomyces sp. NPDC041068]|uniref:hypothetical protein n=1 Tax=Streptomyces sp. NPDC041068 TaxID=3155130 RepID=UPI0033F60AA4